jgi:phenylalanyl-tRNA synthetase beta chain
VASQLAIYHPKKQAELVYQGISIGHIATLHPILLSSVKLPETAAVVSISLNLLRLVELLAQDAGHRYTFETLQDQIVWRDLCFVIDADQSFDAVLSAVRQVPEIGGLEVFDVYAGKTLGEGKKSVSIKIKISGDTSKDAASMTTEHINAIMEAAIKAAGNAGGQLRN